MSIRERWRVLRAWLRAWWLGYGWGRCPICNRPFSCEEIISLPWPEALMQRHGGNGHASYASGPLVCGSPRCQEMARQLNARDFGYSRPRPL